LQGEVQPMPNISMNKFLMFFTNTSKDVESKHLVKFDNIRDIFSLLLDFVDCTHTPIMNLTTVMDGTKPHHSHYSNNIKDEAFDLREFFLLLGKLW
jgi:hypothetical protein